MADYSKVLRRDFKIPQFDRGAKHLRKGEWMDGSDYWLFTCSMVSQCSPLFDSCWDNHDVARRLKKAGVIDDSCEEDGEASQMFVNFKSEKDGLAFLDRLNKYLVKKTEIVREAAAY